MTSIRNRFVALSCLLIAVLILSSAGLAHSALAQDATSPATLPALTKQIKIAVIMPSAKNDQSWSQTMWDSLMTVQKAFGGPSKVMVTGIENMFMVPDAIANAQKFASQGYDIVILHGTQYGAPMFDLAAKFPNVSFAWGTSEDVGADKGLKNIFAYEARAEEGGYLFGTIAATISKSHVLGVVGPINAGDAQLYIDGFTGGAKAVDSSVKVPVIFTQSFGDIPAATAAAKTLLSQGADILTGSAQQVPGAITETQKAGKIWFSTDTDQSVKWPNTVAAAMVYDWTSTLEDMITQRANGVMGGKAYEISLKNGSLQIKFNPKVPLPSNVMAAAQDTIQKLENGTILAPDSPALMAMASATAGATTSADMSSTMAATASQ